MCLHPTSTTLVPLQTITLFPSFCLDLLRTRYSSVKVHHRSLIFDEKRPIFANTGYFGRVTNDLSCQDSMFGRLNV